MNITLSSIGEVVVWLGLICGAVMAIAGMFRYIVLGPLKRHLAAHFAPIQKEMKPNSGSTLRDAIDRLEASHNETNNQLALLSQRLDDHIRTTQAKGVRWMVRQ